MQNPHTVTWAEDQGVQLAQSAPFLGEAVSTVSGFGSAAL